MSGKVGYCRDTSYSLLYRAFLEFRKVWVGFDHKYKITYETLYYNIITTNSKYFKPVVSLL